MMMMMMMMMMMKADEDDLLNDKWCEKEHAAKRHCPEPSSSAISLVWYSIDKAAFDDATWGRVKGDGNCFWRALGVLDERPWHVLKNDALKLCPRIRELWIPYFKADPAMFDALVNDIQGKDAYANEIAFACVSLLTNRSIVVKGVGQAFGIHVVEALPDWSKAMVIYFQSEHFSPLSSEITNEQLGLVRNATPVEVCVNLRGGADQPQVYLGNMEVRVATNACP